MIGYTVAQLVAEKKFKGGAQSACISFAMFYNRQDLNQSRKKIKPSYLQFLKLLLRRDSCFVRGW